MADKDNRAIRKLKALIDENKESVTSLAEKLGIARGTVLGILSGTTEPRHGVMVAAKKLGVQFDDWGHA